MISNYDKEAVDQIFNVVAKSDMDDKAKVEITTMIVEDALKHRDDRKLDETKQLLLFT